METKYAFKVKEDSSIIILSFIWITLGNYSIISMMSGGDLILNSFLLIIFNLFPVHRLYISYFGREEIIINKDEVFIEKKNVLYPGSVNKAKVSYTELKSAEISKAIMRELPRKIRLKLSDPLFRATALYYTFASGADDETADEIVNLINQKIEEANRDSSLRSE